MRSDSPIARLALPRGVVLDTQARRQPPYTIGFGRLVFRIGVELADWASRTNPASGERFQSRATTLRYPLLPLGPFVRDSASGARCCTTPTIPPGLSKAERLGGRLVQATVRLETVQVMQAMRINRTRSSVPIQVPSGACPMVASVSTAGGVIRIGRRLRSGKRSGKLMIRSLNLFPTLAEDALDRYRACITAP